MVTWGGRVRAMALFRWFKLYGRCCGGEKGKRREKRLWVLLGLLGLWDFGKTDPWGLGRLLSGFTVFGVLDIDILDISAAGDGVLLSGGLPCLFFLTNGNNYSV
nr:hypothetical protein [Tanacetum cinerariifolium]